MKTLHLTLTRKWFDMIASGEKKEEYREIKEYWVKRLSDYLVYDGDWFHMEDKPFKEVIAKNGYAKDAPTIRWQHKGIRIGEGKPEWGAEPGKKYFILEIGEILSK